MKKFILVIIAVLLTLGVLIACAPRLDDEIAELQQSIIAVR